MNIGTHAMRLEDFGASATQAGNVQVEATFKAATGETVTWRSGTNETVNPGKIMSQWAVTLKNLQVMGYQGDLSAMGACAALYDGPLGGALTMGEYDIVLVENKWTDDKQVVHTGVKVAFINKPGEGGGVGKKFATKEEMMAAFSKAKKDPF